jgi:hypothetical protein
VFASRDPKQLQSLKSRIRSLYSYVSASPLNTNDAIGLEDVAAFDVDKWLKETGLGTAISKKTMTQSDLMGKSYITSDSCCAEKAECKLTFKLDSAWEGVYTAPITDDTNAGVYVAINATIPEGCCECDELRILQVAREYTLVKGKRQSGKPGGLLRPGLAGSGDDKATNQGWFIDFNKRIEKDVPGALLKDTVGYEPYFGDAAGGRTAVKLWDPPGKPPGTKDIGGEFYTCVVAYSKEKAGGKVVGCLHWGYYIDSKGVPKLAMEGDAPASCNTPSELTSAIDRWNAFKFRNLQFPKISILKER